MAFDYIDNSLINFSRGNSFTHFDNNNFDLGLVYFINECNFGLLPDIENG